MQPKPSLPVPAAILALAAVAASIALAAKPPAPALDRAALAARVRAEMLHAWRGGSAFSRSSVVGRALEELTLYLKWMDPWRTRGFPEAMHEVLVRRQPEPWSLKRSAGFLEAVAADGVDPKALLEAIGAMSVPEKVSLVDQAVAEDRRSLDRCLADVAACDRGSDSASRSRYR
ncbi:MAG TPA: hypothetical protein VJA16_13795 [Thermoanaerobaculia bacterium]